MLQASRRGFLSNLAILTGGAAMGGNALSPFATKKIMTPDLEGLWKAFCKNQAAVPFGGQIENKKDIMACKGHTHYQGKAVYFSKNQIIAQPVWIYWAGNKRQPSDVIINLYKDGIAVKSLNQFELKAICEKDTGCHYWADLARGCAGSQYVARTFIGPGNYVSTRLSPIKRLDFFV